MATAIRKLTDQAAALDIPQAIALAERRAVSLTTMNISSLPDEILTLIFRLTQRTTMISHYAADPDEAPPPLYTGFEIIASHVSLHWRCIAIGDPQLWVNIHLSTDSSVEELVAYLERSQKCPLNVRLDIPRGRRLGGTFDLLTDHLYRWRSFSTGRYGNAPFMRLQNGFAPLLEHISINVDIFEWFESRPIHSDNNATQILIAGAPNLSFVRLGGHAMSFFRPPLESMVTLHLDKAAHLPMTYQRFCHVLTASSVLANLSIHGDIMDHDEWLTITNTTSLIEMPALRSLRLCGIGGGIYCGVLLNISAPGLESLVLKDVIDPDLDKLWDLPEATAPSHKFPALNSLTFCDSACAESTYRKLFGVFPAITHFTSLNSSWKHTPSVLKLLGECVSHPKSPGTATLDMYPPWPNLHTITFLPHPDEASIHAMVKTRINIAHPMSKIRLGGSGNMEVWEVEWLKRCIAVESFDDVDPWPVGLTHVDNEDLFLWS